MYIYILYVGFIMIFQIIDLYHEDWEVKSDTPRAKYGKNGLNHLESIITILVATWKNALFFLGGGWFKMHSIQKVMCFQIFLNLRGGSYITKPSQQLKTQICLALPCYRNTCEA